MLFSDSIPADYDTYLGPFFFEFYAEDLARRLAVEPGGALLETSCGTGISTQALHRHLGPHVSIFATDVSEGMLRIARERRGELDGVRFMLADACALEFEDGAFDAVASQFGLMFYPDRALALREAHRVLRPGGRIALSIWGGQETNPYVPLTMRTLARHFDADPPRFMEIPFGLDEREPVRGLFEQAGFVDVELHHVPFVSERPTALEVATGLVRGNPNIHEVEERANASVDDVVADVARVLADAFGDAPIRVPMEAIVVTAARGEG